MLYLLHIMKEWISHDFEHSFDEFGWFMIGEESLEKGWSKEEWLEVKNGISEIEPGGMKLAPTLAP